MPRLTHLHVPEELSDDISKSQRLAPNKIVLCWRNLVFARGIYPLAIAEFTFEVSSSSEYRNTYYLRGSLRAVFWGVFDL